MAATKQATKSAKQQQDDEDFMTARDPNRNPADRQAASDRIASDTAPATTSDGAIVEPAASSQQAAEQRRAAPHVAVLGGEGSAKDADTAKPVTFAPDHQPANPEAIDQLRTLESRQRAKLVGESVAATSSVGVGTAEPGKAEVRTRSVPIAREPAEVKTQDVQEIAVPLGGRELVFAEHASGGVAVQWHDVSRINALSGPGHVQEVAVIPAEAWAKVAGLKAKGAGGDLPKAQSAEEQRKGVATKGGDPGPAAPQDVRL